MAKHGSFRHEFYLEETLNYLKGQGFRVINLANKTPDGIAISKDGKIFAIEIVNFSKRGDDLERRAKDKISDYIDLGFDNVYALTINKDGEFKSLWRMPDEGNQNIEKLGDEAPKWKYKLWDTEASMS